MGSLSNVITDHLFSGFNPLNQGEPVSNPQGDPGSQGGHPQSQRPQAEEGPLQGITDDVPGPEADPGQDDVEDQMPQPTAAPQVKYSAVQAGD